MGSNSSWYRILVVQPIKLVLSPMISCKQLLLAAATAVLVVANYFLICKPYRKGRRDRTAEEEPLQDEETMLDSPPATDASVSQSAYQPPQPADFQQGEQLQQSNSQQQLSPQAAAKSALEALFAPDLDVGEDAVPIQNPETLTQEQVSIAFNKPIKPRPAAGPADEDEPVDEDYLKGLLDKEFGPPKFAVPKHEPVEKPDQAALQALLDKEFGPPKFAVPKSASPHPPPSTSNAPIDTIDEEEASTSGSKRGIADASVPSVTLEVLTGPAAGRSFITDDTSIKHTIGRNPDCQFQILDQEISGKHAVLHWSDEELRWVLTDLGSLNGSLLNGKVISKEYHKAGPEEKLSDHDVLELGSLTKVKVLFNSGAKRQQTESTAPTPAGSNDSAFDGRASLRGNSTRLLTQLPPHLAVETNDSLGMHFVVHQKVGTDHKRLNQACEDVPAWEVPFAPYDKSALICVYDGHHGGKAANQAKDLLPGVLRSKLEAAGQTSVVAKLAHPAQKQLLRDVFLETDTHMSMDEGCTATVVMLERNTAGWSLQSANVGDSSAVLIDVTSRQWHKMTEDHRIASSSSERARLQQRGHTVRTRLYGLNISRMLGDRFLKDEDLGFLAEPSVSQVYEVPADHTAYLLVASDGLWDVLSEEKAASNVLKAAADGETISAEAIADLLLHQAMYLKSKDDVTVVVVELSAVIRGAAGADGAERLQ